MLGALRNNYHVSSFDLLLFAAYDGFADSGGEDEVLVDCVDLGSVGVFDYTMPG